MSTPSLTQPPVAGSGNSVEDCRKLGNLVGPPAVIRPSQAPIEMSVVYASASLVILQTGDQRAVLYRDDTKNRELARTELKINAKLQVYVLYEDKNTTNCIVGLKPPDPSDLWECLHSPGASLAGTKKRATVDYIEVDFKKSTTGRIGRNEFLSLEEFNSIARLPHGSPIDCRILGVYGRKTKKLILGLPAKGPCSE